MDNKDNALEVLLGGLPEHKITGVDGKKYTFTRIDLVDIKDLVSKYGDIFSGGLEKNAEGKTSRDLILEAIDFHLFVAWLGLRKAGLTDDQIEKGEWKIGIRKVASILPTNIPYLRELTAKIFEMSGYGLIKKEDEPKTGDEDEEIKNSSREEKTPPLKTE